MCTTVQLRYHYKLELGRFNERFKFLRLDTSTITLKDFSYLGVVKKLLNLNGLRILLQFYLGGGGGTDGNKALFCNGDTNTFVPLCD